MAESMEELVNCSICLDRFTNPKVLPCQHTFCLNCLRRIAANARVLNCPTCRKEHAIPEHNVQKFNDNLMAKNLIEMLNAGTGMASGTGDGPQVQPKTAKECPDCRRKMHLSKCRHCSELVCADCRASHVELATEIKFILNIVENHAADDAPAEGDEIWKDFLQRIENEQERLPLLFDQLQTKINQRKEEITVYLDLTKKRLQRLLRQEETPLQRSVQQRVTDCKTTSTLRGLKNLLESTDTMLASVLQSEGKEKFEVSLESADDMGHVVYGDRKMEIVGAGGRTFTGPVKPERSVLRNQNQRISWPGKVLYQDKNAQFRDYVYGHPDSDIGVFKPLYALYSDVTDSIYAIHYDSYNGVGKVLVLGMDTHSAHILCPLVRNAHHLALTNSGKLLIAQSVGISIVDLCGNSALRRIGFPDVSYPSQICAHGNDLVILDPDENRIVIYDEDYQLVREIKLQVNINRDSKMAVNGDNIYVTGSDVKIRKRDCGEQKGCANCGRNKKPLSVEKAVCIPIIVYSPTGGHVQTFNLDIPVGIFHYMFNASCNNCGNFSTRSDLSVLITQNPGPNVAAILRGFCVDSEAYVCITSVMEDGHCSVLVYTPEHKLLCKIEAPDSKQASFKDPRGVSLMPDGRLIVCDCGKNRIQII